MDVFLAFVIVGLVVIGAALVTVSLVDRSIYCNICGKELRHGRPHMHDGVIVELR